MNPGMIVGIALLLSAVVGFGWQLYDGWLAFSEIASQARDVRWWAQVQAATPLQFLIRCEVNPECRAMLHEFVPTRTTVWPHLWKVSSGVAFAGALTLAVSRPKPGKTFGARFAGLGDVRRLILSDLLEPRHAFMLGRLKGQVLAAQRGRTLKERKTQPVLGHVPTVAPSQTGKSYALAANALYTPASLVMVDIKGEQHRLSSGFRTTLGKVVVLTPDGVGGCYDPFADLGTDAQDIERAARLITHDPRDRDPYWAEAASYGVAAAIRAAQIEGTPPLGYLQRLLRQACGSGKAFADALAAVDDPLTAEFLETFLGMPPEEATDEHFNAPRGHIASGWNALVKRTKPYLLPGVLALTSGSDFKAKDLLTRTTTVYLVWPEHELENLAGPLNLILTALITALAKETDAQPAQTHRPGFIAVDEAGRVRVPNLPAHSATLAGRNISLALYVQALDQLWDTYGVNGGETILSNCHHKVFHPALSLKTAEYISRNLGQVSVSEERRSRAPGLFSQETITQGYATRPLLTPDEVRMLGRDEVIILSRDALPIRGKRLGFPDLKLLRGRAKLRPTPLGRLELPNRQLLPPADEEGQSSAEATDAPARRSRTVHEREQFRLKDQLDKGMRRLRAEANPVVTQDARGRVRAIAGAFAQGSVRRLEITLRELYGIVYHTAPEAFFEQYKHMSTANLRNAVMSLIPVLEANNTMHAVMTNKVGKEIVDKFLSGSWGTLTRQLQLQVPTAPHIRAAWELIDKAFPKATSVSIDRALLPLLDAPYGYDYNTLTLLFSSWYGFHKRELEIHQNGRVITLEKLGSVGKAKPDSFISALGACNLWRRDAGLANREVREAVDRIERGGLSRSQAEKDRSRLELFQTDDEGKDPRLSADADAALAKVRDGLSYLTEYESVAHGIKKAMDTQGEKSIASFGAQLKQLEKLPPLFTVLSSDSTPDALRDTVLARLRGTAVMQCEAYERLTQITDYGMHAKNLKQLKKELERLNLSGLETRVEEALARLDAARDQLAARRREQQDITAIKQSAPAFLPEELRYEHAEMRRQVAARLDGLQLEAIEDRFKKLDSAKRAACLQRLERVMRELETA